jgi:hypothetical protein
MGLLRYSEQEFRDLVKRIIPVRWPNERMLLVTDCRGERVPAALDPVDGPSDPFTLTEAFPSSGGHTKGFLAATQSRVIYQERLQGTALMKGIVALTAALALAALFFGNGLVDFLGMALLAWSLWLVARVAEHFIVGNVNIEFGRFAFVDPTAQQIDGMSLSGSVYRLHIPDASDFQLIRALAERQGSAEAA